MNQVRVSLHDRMPMLSNMVQHAGFFAGQLRLATEAAEMSPSDSGDDRHLGRDQSGERRDLSRRIGAHLHQQPPIFR